MLEVFTRLITFFIMNITSVFIIKNISNTNIKILNIRVIFLIFINVLIQYLLYNVTFSIHYTSSVFLVNVFIFKLIFKHTFTEILVSTSIATILIFLIDVVFGMATLLVFHPNEIRELSSINLIASIIVFGITMILHIDKIKNKMNIFYKTLIRKDNIFSMIILLISISNLIIIAYSLATNTNIIENEYINIILVTVYFLLIYIIVNEKNKNNNLIDEYDNLFTYIQNFEEWIEKDQLNRHEYKNQLAVLRLMAKSKKLKEKIDEILDDTVDINNEIINELSTLPKGGIKGLMYYKAAVAQKQKINLTVNVSLQKNTYLKQLTTEHLKDMNRLIGIYFDNAIEAARDTKMKIILAEIYEFDSKVKFVISNSFKKSSNIENKYQKGKSSKGAGRGNGLYFASKIIKKYKRIEEKQEIIDDYYIQSITLNKRKNLTPKN